MGYATTVMQQRGPSHAVGDKIIEARSVLSRTNQCTRADGKGVLQSYKNKFYVPLTSPTSLEMLKHPHYTHWLWARSSRVLGRMHCRVLLASEGIGGTIARCNNDSSRPMR